MGSNITLIEGDVKVNLELCSIWMPHPHVTSPLPDDLEACPLQSMDYFTGFQ
jgi:hypothetical protein